MDFVELVIDGEDQAELRATLKAHGIPIVIRAMTFDSAIGAAVAHIASDPNVRFSVKAAMLPVLAKVLEAWLKANAGRKLSVKLREGKITEVSAQGYSVDDAIRWLEAASHIQAIEAGKVPKNRKKGDV